MPAPRGKPTRIEGGTRPWNVAMPKDKGAGPVTLRGQRPETENERAERVVCLRCQLPDCQQESPRCGLREVKRERPPKHRKSRPIPEGFAEAFETMQLTALEKRFGVGSTTIRRWRDELGLPAKKHIVTKTRPIPEDFADVAWDMTLLELAIRYGASKSTVSRWRQKVGVKPAKQSKYTNERRS